MELIDNLTGLDYSTFNKSYFNRKPVIVKDAVKHTRAYKNWSTEYLGEKAGSRLVNVSHSKRGVYTIEDDVEIRNIQMPFEKAMELFATGNINETYYLQETSMFEYFPGLLADMEIPPLHSKSDIIERINFWMGGKGCLTQLHIDSPHNFLVQLRGKKELTLFAPEDAANLYPKSGGIKAHESQVDLDNIDYGRFPLARNAKPFFGCLEEGDMLYLPPNWWHQVRTVEMSISVNYWWNRFDIMEGTNFENFEVPKLCFIIQSFLSNGLSIDHMDEEGELLLLKAIRKGYVNVVEAFLTMGANPNSVSSVYKPGMSALALAKEGGNEGIINLLQRFGAATEVVAG